MTSVEVWHCFWRLKQSRTKRGGRVRTTKVSSLPPTSSNLRDGYCSSVGFDFAETQFAMTIANTEQPSQKDGIIGPELLPFWVVLDSAPAVAIVFLLNLGCDFSGSSPEASVSWWQDKAGGCAAGAHSEKPILQSTIQTGIQGTLLRTFVLLFLGCSSLGSRLIFSGHPLLSMNQPPGDTMVNDLGGAAAAAASVVGVLQSGAPFRYRDVSELFMRLEGCRRQTSRNDKWFHLDRQMAIVASIMEPQDGRRAKWGPGATCGLVNCFIQPTEPHNYFSKSQNQRVVGLTG